MEHYTPIHKYMVYRIRFLLNLFFGLDLQGILFSHHLSSPDFSLPRSMISWRQLDHRGQRSAGSIKVNYHILEASHVPS